MEVRKPIYIPQMELVTAINTLILEHNKGMKLEFDMYMMQPCIEAANEIIKTLESWGDFPFACECESEHDEECFLHGVEPYDITKRHENEWQAILNSIERLENGFSYGELLAGHRNMPYNVFKGLLMQALSQDLIERKNDELFYKKAITQK